MQLIVSGTIGRLGHALQHAEMEWELIPERKKFQLHMEVKNVAELLLLKKCVTFNCVHVWYLPSFYIMAIFLIKNIIWILLSHIWQWVKLPFLNEQYLISAVHCVWDEWMEGSCSVTCGVGTRTNTRTKLVHESNGGTCTGSSTEDVICEDQLCPSKYTWCTIKLCFA